MANTPAKSNKPMPSGSLADVPAMAPGGAAEASPPPPDCEVTRDLFSGRPVTTPVRKPEPPAGPAMAEQLKAIQPAPPPRLPEVGEVVHFGTYNPGAEGQVTVRPALVLDRLPDRTLCLKVFTPGADDYQHGVAYTPEPRWNHWTFPPKAKG